MKFMVCDLNTSNDFKANYYIDDINQMMSLGITTVPVLKVDGEMLSYTDAVKYVNKGGIK